MASLLGLCCGWLGRTHDEAAEDEPTERTALLTDALPQLPKVQQVVDTQQQLEDQAAARQIVDEASERIINVTSAAPFSSFRVTFPPSSSSSPPAGQASESPWRPDVHQTPVDSVRRLRLGFDPSPRKPGPNGQSIRGRQSAHSLHTLPRQGHGLPVSSGDERRRSHADDGQSQHGTMASYRTANDGLDLHTPPRSSRAGKTPLTGVWAPDSDVRGYDVEGETDGEEEDASAILDPLPPDDPNRLTDDPVKLRALIDSGFKLKDPGPFFESL